jgi:hypothetical protein
LPLKTDSQQYTFNSGYEDISSAKFCEQTTLEEVKDKITATDFILE